MGRVVIEPHQFFMAMYADSVGRIRSGRTEWVADRHAARLALLCRPSPAPPRRPSARGRPRARPVPIEATDGGTGARAARPLRLHRLLRPERGAGQPWHLRARVHLHRGDDRRKITVGPPIWSRSYPPPQPLPRSQGARSETIGRPLTGSVVRCTRRWLVGSRVRQCPSAVPASRGRQCRAGQCLRPPGWRPWLLTSGDELRPAKPAPPTPDELTELVELQGQRTAARSQPSPSGAIQRSSCPGPTSPSISFGCTRPTRSAPRERWPSFMSRSPTHSWRPRMRVRPTRGRASGGQSHRPPGKRWTRGSSIPFGSGGRGGGRLDRTHLPLPKGVGRDVYSACGRSGHESTPRRASLPQ